MVENICFLNKKTIMSIVLTLKMFQSVRNYLLDCLDPQFRQPDKFTVSAASAYYDLSLAHSHIAVIQLKK